MASYTTTQLIDLARLYADERPGGSAAFITDAETLGLINAAAEELYSELLDNYSGHGWFEKATVFDTADGSDLYDLPSDHLQTVQLLIVWNNDQEQSEELHAFEWGHVTGLHRGTWCRAGAKGFRISRTEYLQILPTPTTVEHVSHIYIPVFTPVAAGESIDLVVPGWQRWVALQAAVAMRDLQDLDAARLAANADRALARMLSLMQNRTRREPDVLVDADPEGDTAQWWPRYTE